MDIPLHDANFWIPHSWDELAPPGCGGPIPVLGALRAPSLARASAAPPYPSPLALSSSSSATDTDLAGLVTAPPQASPATTGAGGHMTEVGWGRGSEAPWTRGHGRGATAGGGAPWPAAAWQAGDPGSASGTRGTAKGPIISRPAAKPAAAAAVAVEPAPPPRARKGTAKGPSAAAAATAGGSGAPRRGRPPKQPGKFSKGYLAVKRWRQKKKNMVEQTEQDIEALRAQVQRMEEEQQLLRQREHALQLAAAAQDQLLGRLCWLKHTMGIGAGPELLSGAPNAAELVAALAAGEAAAGAAGDGPACAQAATSQAATGQATADRRVEPQLAAWLAQPAGGGIAAEVEVLWWRPRLPPPPPQRVAPPSASGLVARYKAYVADCGVRVAALELRASAGQGVGHRRAAPSGKEGPAQFAPFPFVLADVVQLWGLAELPGAPSCSYGEGAAACPQQLQWAVGGGGAAAPLIDLVTGEIVPVSWAFWAHVSSMLAPLEAPQLVCLTAAARLYARALDRLEGERAGVLRRLEDARPAAEAAPGAALLGLERCMAAAADVELHLVRSRVLLGACGWALSCAFDAEQLARLCVASWPYVPALPAIAVHLLGCWPRSE